MDLLPLDTPIPCNKPTNIFMKSKFEQPREQKIRNKVIYIWNGSHLYPEPNLQYEHIALLEHLSNKCDLHIVTNGVFDESHEKVDALMKLSMAMDLLVTMANSLHIVATSFGSQMLLHGANNKHYESSR